MKLTVTFVDENLNPISKQELEFKTAPKPNDVLTLLIDSQTTSYKVITVGGIPDNGSYTPTVATFQRVSSQ